MPQSKGQLHAGALLPQEYKGFKTQTVSVGRVRSWPLPCWPLNQGHFPAAQKVPQGQEMQGVLHKGAACFPSCLGSRPPVECFILLGSRLFTPPKKNPLFFLVVGSSKKMSGQSQSLSPLLGFFLPLSLSLSSLSAILPLSVSQLKHLT